MNKIVLKKRNNGEDVYLHRNHPQDEKLTSTVHYARKFRTHFKASAYRNIHGLTGFKPVVIDGNG